MIGTEEWGIANLTDVESGLLHGSVSGTYAWVWRPSEARIVEILGEPVIDFGVVHDPESYPDKWGWDRVTATDGALDEFARLAEAPDSVILAFARKWGPLFECASHRWRCHWSPHSGRIRGCKWSGKERIDYWRTHSLTARSVLNAAALIHTGKVVPYRVWSELGADQDLALNLQRKDRAEQRASLTVFVRSQLMRFTAGPAFNIAPDLDVCVESGFGALPMIWFQLIQTIGYRASLAICAGCGQAFSPRRKPRDGERSFCTECGRKASRRLSARDRRAATTQSAEEDTDGTR